MNNKIRSAFYDDPQVLMALDVKDRQELVDKVNQISTPDLAFILRGDKGEKGDTGDQGEQGIQGERGEPGKDGRNGRDGESVMGPQGPAGKDSISEYKTEVIREEAIIDDRLVKKVIAIMRKLPEKDRLDISAIKNAQSFIFGGKRYKTEELMHGGGSSGGGAFTGSQEKSTTIPNGVLTTFAFTHTPTLIYWNGAFQTLTDDYTVGGNSITFTASAGIPQTGDKITNVYA